MAQKNKKLNAKLTELNNKTRKGTYLYLKQPKKPGKYYKLQQNTNTTAIKKHYTTNQKKPYTKYLQQIKKKPTINKAIKKGITTTTTKNILNATNKTIKKVNQKSIKTLVKDKDLLKIVSKEENLKKIRHRYEHRITLTNGS